MATVALPAVGRTDAAKVAARAAAAADRLGEDAMGGVRVRDDRAASLVADGHRPAIAAGRGAAEAHRDAMGIRCAAGAPNRSEPVIVPAPPPPPTL